MPLPRTPALALYGVPIDARGWVLLVRPGHAPFKGQHALPGGFGELGETVEDACRREVGEANGVRARRLRLLGVSPIPGVTRVATVARQPSWRACGGCGPGAGDDAAAVAWVEQGAGQDCHWP